MRIPLVPDADSRDGTSNKDERLTNVLVEQDSVMLACVRPGLNTISANSGAGSGVVCFSGTLISVFGTALGHGNTPASISTVVNGMYDFAQIP
jgi:hypothetical protein